MQGDSSDAEKQRLIEDAARYGAVLPDDFFDDQEDDDFVVFYDAWRAVKLFFKVKTQWQYSMEGLTGLNYASVIDVIKLHEKNEKKRVELLDEVSAIERGFLKALHEKREKNNK